MDLCTGMYIRLINCRSLQRPSLKCCLMKNYIAATEGKKTPKSAQDIRNNLLRGRGAISD